MLAYYFNTVLDKENRILYHCHLNGVNGGSPARFLATAALRPYLSLSCMYVIFRPMNRRFSFSIFSLCATFLNKSITLCGFVNKMVI